MAEFYKKKKKVCQMCAGKTVDYKDVEVDSITVTSTNDASEGSNVWNWKSKVLPAYKQGKKITYTVEEVLPGGYTNDVTKYAVVNTAQKEEIKNPIALTVKKLISGSEATLNGVTFTLTNSDKVEIDYTTSKVGSNSKNKKSFNL